MAIIGAEWVMRWLPKGTHDWNKFITPDELYALIEKAGLDATRPQRHGVQPDWLYLVPLRPRPVVQLRHHVGPALTNPHGLGVRNAQPVHYRLIRSISTNSASVNPGFRTAPTQSVTCSGFDAPIRAEVMPPPRNTQAIAICGRVCPRASAISFNARTLARSSPR